jgi:GTP-binding protein
MTRATSNEKRVTVVIVGRPNVGKSALFNRLAGKRIAIVDPTYGLTRDRVSTIAEYGGRRFTLVDTGGMDFDTHDRIREMTIRQTKQGIAEADAVLLVVDAIEGLAPLDREIAGLLRAAGKRVIVAVNKADNDRLEAAASDFHRLGFPALFAVSAAHGRGIDALLDAIVADIPEAGGGEQEETFRIAVVGRPNVGKSSYVNRILREERMIVHEAPGTTRDAVDTHASWRGRPITLIDTAGMRRERKVRSTAELFSLARTRAGIRRCDLSLLLIDALEGMGAQDERLARYILDQGKGCVLGVNKWDLAQGAEMRRYRESLWRRMRFFDYVPVVFMSAKTGQGIERSLEAAFSVRDQMDKKITTSVLNRALRDIWDRSAPPARGRKACKLFYTAQTATRPPTFRIFVNDRSLLDAPYGNYLTNGLRRAFGFKGTPIRLEFRNRRSEGCSPGAGTGSYCRSRMSSRRRCVP